MSRHCLLRAVRNMCVVVVVVSHRRSQRVAGVGHMDVRRASVGALEARPWGLGVFRGGRGSLASTGPPVGSVLEQGVEFLPLGRYVVVVAPHARRS